jgi:TM2 domain-containing membrane protein YozV
MMNEILSHLLLGLFLALPPILLFLRFWNQKPGWFILLLLIAILGWVLLYGSFIFYHQHIADLAAQNKELPEGWGRDGATGLAIMFFGWLLSIFYSLPWLLVYALARVSGTRRKKS